MENVEAILTVSEETAINIRVKPDNTQNDDYVSLFVEPYDCHNMLNNAWVRESLLFDVKSIKDRCNIAKIIITMYKSIIYDDKTTQIILKDNKITETKVQSNNDVKTNKYEKYDDMDTDVTHINEHRPFFNTTSIIGIDESDGYNSYTLINHSCNVYYIGYTEYDGNIPNKEFFVETLDDMSKLLDDVKRKDMPRLVLVVNPQSSEHACSIIDRYYAIIDCVICDTFQLDDRAACMILSIAKRRGILMCRGVSIANQYNFNVDIPASSESFVGIIDMGDETEILGDYHYLIKIDPRMAQLRDYCIILNKRKHVKFILLNQQVHECHLSNIDNYKIFPKLQTSQLSNIDQLSRGHILHTPIAVITQHPGIATMLVSCGIYASCRVSTVLEYRNKVLAALANEYYDVTDMLSKRIERISIKDKMDSVFKEIKK